MKIIIFVFIIALLAVNFQWQQALYRQMPSSIREVHQKMVMAILLVLALLLLLLLLLLH